MGGAKCTRIECCRKSDACNIRHCGWGYTLKKKLPHYCTGPRCSQEECCDKSQVCTSAVCGNGWALRKQSLFMPCFGSNCTQEECCETDCSAQFRVRDEDKTRRLTRYEFARCLMGSCSLRVMVVLTMMIRV